MAVLTDDEKKELQKLNKDELINLLDRYKEDAEKQREADKAAIIDKFLNGGKISSNSTADDSVDAALDLSNNKAFQSLRNKFGGI